MGGTINYALDPSKLPPHASCSDGLKRGDHAYQGWNSKGNLYCHHDPTDGNPSWYHYYNMMDDTVCSTFHHNQDGTDSYHNILCGYAWHRTPEPDSPSEAEDTAAPEVEPGDAHGPEQPAGPSTSPDRVKLEEGHDDDTDLQSDQKPIKTEDDMKVEDQKIKLEVIDEDIKQEQPTVAFDVDPAVGPAPGSNASESGSGVDGGGVKRNKRHSARLNPTVSKSIDPETMRVTRSVTTTMSKGSH